MNIENELIISLELYPRTTYFGICLKILKKRAKYRVREAQIGGLSNASWLFRLEVAV
jgi:hypothetical protein